MCGMRTGKQRWIFVGDDDDEIMVSAYFTVIR